MKDYHLKLNDVKDFIPELANRFGIDFKNNLGEYHLKIPEQIGEGDITGINYPNGIGFYTYYCKFNDDIEITIEEKNLSPLRLIYCVSGEISTHFQNLEQTTSVGKHEYLITAPLAEESQSLIFKKDTDLAICYLEINRQKFQNFLSFDLHEVEPIFYKIFNDTEGKNQLCKTGKYSLRTADTLNEIKEYNISGFPRINLIGAKAMEILSYMLSRFKDSEQDFYEKNIKEKDFKAIEKAAQHIQNNLATAGRVNDLAQIAGVNTNKLQEGFQAIYGKTVNEYLRDARLKRAIKMLNSGNKNVSEVVYELGLSSRSYFSKIFKAKYGISPRKILSDKSVTVKEEA